MNHYEVPRNKNSLPFCPERLNPRKLVLAVIVMGFSGIVAQVLLFREFLITVLGNELTIGIILANWLILESAGALLVGKRIEKTGQKIEAFAAATLVFSLALPLAVYLARDLRDILSVVPGKVSASFRYSTLPC